MNKIVVSMFLLMASIAHAGDVYVQGGSLQNNSTDAPTWTLQGGFFSNIGDKWGAGASYINEGHSDNHHRDGLALQGYYESSIGGTGLKYQIAAGPYISNNNTVIDGRRLNDFRIGIMTSVALKYYLDQSWYMRLQYNHIAMQTADSSSLLVGVGRDFGYNQPTDLSDTDFTIGVWTGTSRTTQIGAQQNATSYMVEGKRALSKSLAYSVGYLHEGDTQLANRQGVFAQMWYEYRPTDRWIVGAGIGPYLAQDQRQTEGSNRAMMIGSIRATREYRMFDVGVAFNRVSSFYNRDQDLFMVGISKKF